MLRGSLMKFIMKISTPYFAASVLLSTCITCALLPQNAQGQGTLTLEAIGQLHKRADATFASGDHETASKLYEKLVKYRLPKQGAKAYEIGIIYNNLGVIQQKGGETEEAFGHFDQALENFRASKGAGHRDVATVLNNVGLTKLANGDHDDAIKLFEESIAIRLKTLGKTHPDLGDCHEGIGLCLSAKGEETAAIEAFQKCLDLRVAALGKEHLYVAAAHMGLAMAYLEKKDFDKADELEAKAKAIVKKTGGLAVIYRDPNKANKPPPFAIFKIRPRLGL